MLGQQLLLLVLQLLVLKHQAALRAVCGTKPVLCCQLSIQGSTQLLLLGC